MESNVQPQNGFEICFALSNTFILLISRKYDNTGPFQLYRVTLENSAFTFTMEEPWSYNAPLAFARDFVALIRCLPLRKLVSALPVDGVEHHAFQHAFRFLDDNQLTLDRLETLAVGPSCFFAMKACPLVSRVTLSRQIPLPADPSQPIKTFIDEVARTLKHPRSIEICGEWTDSEIRCK